MSEEKLELAHWRQRFVKCLDLFEQDTVTFFPEVNHSYHVFVPPTMDEYEHDEDLALLQNNPLDADNTLPEYKEIILPLALLEIPQSMQAACLIEIELRVVQIMPLHLSTWT